jgi:hypothetical protein
MTQNHGIHLSNQRNNPCLKMELLS